MIVLAIFYSNKGQNVLYVMDPVRKVPVAIFELQIMVNAESFIILIINPYKLGNPIIS